MHCQIIKNENVLLRDNNEVEPSGLSRQDRNDRLQRPRGEEIELEELKLIELVRKRPPLDRSNDPQPLAVRSHRDDGGGVAAVTLLEHHVRHTDALCLLHEPDASGRRYGQDLSVEDRAQRHGPGHH